MGVDLGGTKIMVGRVEDGTVVARSKASTPTEGPERVAEVIAELADDVDEGDGLPIGVGAPGQIDSASGSLLTAANLVNWEPPVPFAELVAAAADRSHVALGNDVNVAALGEHWGGAGKGVDDLLAVFVGTGVGGGAILDGELRTGPTGLAGEIGHIPVGLGDGPCGCGGRDHLESYAGRRNLVAEAKRRAKAGESTILFDDRSKPKSSTVAAAHADGDALVVELIDRASIALQRGVVAAVILYDLERVVLGGGLAERFMDLWIAELRAAIAGNVFITGDIDVVPASLGDFSGVVGAARLTRQKRRSRS